jgi:multiple sugar transport system permease protein/putative aldouronate transport system permease protein
MAVRDNTGNITVRNTIKLSFNDRVFYFFNNMFLWIALLLTLYPIVYIVSASFSSANAVTTGKVVLWPVDFSLEGYIAVFKDKSIVTGYYNSILYTVVGTVINVTMTLLAAFPLSRREMVGCKPLNFIFAFTMWFSGGMIPTYLLIRDLGWINTRWALWIPGAVGVWNVIITRTYFQTSVPEELFESANIDGCGYFRYFTSIVLPLSGAITAVITLFYAVGHWNAYFNAFLYLNKKDLFPLQLVLRDILIQNSIDWYMAHR